MSETTVYRHVLKRSARVYALPRRTQFQCPRMQVIVVSTSVSIPFRFAHLHNKRSIQMALLIHLELLFGPSLFFLGL